MNALPCPCRHRRCSDALSTSLSPDNASFGSSKVAVAIGPKRHLGRRSDLVAFVGKAGNGNIHTSSGVIWRISI
jgi:hypothetical protein